MQAARQRWLSGVEARDAEKRSDKLERTRLEAATAQLRREAEKLAYATCVCARVLFLSRSPSSSSL
jgi:hypothetical protein